ncbi:MAG: hypothetical protein ABSG70_14355 [Terriglobales bacterium]|jgi:hypothetical protein
MNRFALLLLLSGLASAQTGTEPPARVPLPPASPSTSVNMNDSESAHKARALLDQTIEALGGHAYLTYANRSESGRYYPLHHGRTDSTGLPYNYYVEYPDKDRFEVLTLKDLHIIPGTIDIGGVKSGHKDLVLIHNGDQGFEVSYKGTAAQDKIDLQNYLRRRSHSIEWIFRKWLTDPTVALFYDSLDVVDSKPAEGVTLLNSHDDSVSVWIDQTSHYPIKISYSWRDPKDKQKNIEEEVYDHYKPEEGIMTPHSITRYFNGETSQQRFIFTAKYNLNLPDTMFDANVTYDPKAPLKHR